MQFLLRTRLFINENIDKTLDSTEVDKENKQIFKGESNIIENLHTIIPILIK